MCRVIASLLQKAWHQSFSKIGGDIALSPLQTGANMGESGQENVSSISTYRQLCLEPKHQDEVTTNCKYHSNQCQLCNKQFRDSVALECESKYYPNNLINNSRNIDLQSQDARLLRSYGAGLLVRLNPPFSMFLPHIMPDWRVSGQHLNSSRLYNTLQSLQKYSNQTTHKLIKQNFMFSNIQPQLVNSEFLQSRSSSYQLLFHRYLHSTSALYKTQPGLNIHVALLNLAEHGDDMEGLRRFQFQGRSLQDMMSLTEADWEAMVDLRQLSEADQKIYEAHKAAVAVGDRFYEDPKTGYIVMTRQAHLKRGTCCGNACRHCPFGHVAVNPALRDKFHFNSAFFH